MIRMSILQSPQVSLREARVRIQIGWGLSFYKVRGVICGVSLSVEKREGRDPYPDCHQQIDAAMDSGPGGAGIRFW